jgi:hypothetical protein
VYLPLTQELRSCAATKGEGHRPRTARSVLMPLTGPESGGDTARLSNAGWAAQGALLFPSSGPKIGFSNRYAQCKLDYRNRATGEEK